MASGLPTGVVTLLFTDVESSTRLLHELGDDYGEALQEHRRRLRAAFAEHEGVEVDTQGDAFFVVFARASNAVAAAADCQRALAGGPIRVRMGLHTGEPRLTEEGYVGLNVHKGARIAAVGHGGQVLMSEPTKALVDAEVRHPQLELAAELPADEIGVFGQEEDALAGSEANDGGRFHKAAGFYFVASSAFRNVLASFAASSSPQKCRKKSRGSSSSMWL